MKRVYKNSDIKISLSIAKSPINPEIADIFELKFYTLNKGNFVKKTKADIIDNTVLLEWNELAKLEQGILYLAYNAAIMNAEMNDNYDNTTAEDIITGYFIMSDISKDKMTDSIVTSEPFSGNISDYF